MTPPRLIFTLFPYTTLFRSTQAPAIDHHPRRVGAGDMPPRINDRADHHRQRPPVIQDGVAEADQDRKSTRLNSSHTVISYAVFCLKKKTFTVHMQRNSLVAL